MIVSVVQGFIQRGPWDPGTPPPARVPPPIRCISRCRVSYRGDPGTPHPPPARVPPPIRCISRCRVSYRGDPGTPPPPQQEFPLPLDVSVGAGFHTEGTPGPPPVRVPPPIRCISRCRLSYSNFVKLRHNCLKKRKWQWFCKLGNSQLAAKNHQIQSQGSYYSKCF